MFLPLSKNIGSLGIFDRVGLKTNQKKTVSMTCRPCSTPGNRSDETYGHTMTRDGPTPRERKRERVTCGDCGLEVAVGSLDSHCMTQHGKARGSRWAWTDAATGGEEQKTYRMEFPKGGTKDCPVEGCLGRAETRTAMRVHFWRRHVRDTVIILEEGNLPHPWCENCGMLVPWRALNVRHKDTAMCRSGVERKRRRLAEAEIREST